MKNYYKILGIEEEATEEEIRQGWIEMTKRCHSDMKEGDQRTEEINEAYQVLEDESKRFAYDLERLLKRSILKKTQETKGRSPSIKKISISASLLIFSLFVGTTIFGWFQVAIQPKSDILPISSLRVKESTKMVPFLPLAKDNSKPKEGPFGQLTTESGRLPEGETEAPKEAPRIMPQETPRTFSEGIQRPDEPKPILMEPRPAPNPDPAFKVENAVVPPSLPTSLAKGDSKPKEGPFRQLTAESRELAKVEMETPKEIPKIIPQEPPKIV